MFVFHHPFLQKLCLLIYSCRWASLEIYSKILLLCISQAQIPCSVSILVSLGILQRLTWIENFQPFPKRQISDSSKLKQLAHDNFKIDENGRKFSKWVENTEEKGEIACHEQFLFFPVFSKDLYCRHVKARACLGKG